MDVQLKNIEIFILRLTCILTLQEVGIQVIKKVVKQEMNDSITA